MATRYVETVDPTSDQTIAQYLEALNDASGANVVAIAGDKDTGALHYFDRVNDAVREVLTADGTETLTNKTLTSPTIAAGALSGTFTGDPTLSGDPAFTGSPTGVVVAKTVAFIENESGTSYVGTVPLPAGTSLIDILFGTSVLWNGTSADLIIGDDDDPNGWLDSVSLKATDVLVGEVFRAGARGANDTVSGAALGVTTAYNIAATGRWGNVASGNAGFYYAAANNVIATITPGAADGTAGRSFMTVLYAVGDAIAQVAT